MKRFRKILAILFVIILLVGVAPPLPVLAVTTNFAGSTSDGYLHIYTFGVGAGGDAVSWNAAHDGVNADSKADTGVSARVHVDAEQAGLGNYWTTIERAGLYFDTSGIPDGANITNATLKLYVISKTTTIGNFDVIIQGDNASTYPHDPLVVGDYLYTHYAGDYGQKNTTTITAGQYNSWTLTASGIAAISKTATTKFILREEQHDEDDVQPNYVSKEINDVSFYTREQGSGYYPILEVTYSAVAPSIQVDAASNIAQTSARLNATVLDDGYESCRVRFGYGNVTQTAPNFNSYDNITAWSAYEWDTGEHPYFDATSMNSSMTFYYRAQIDNSASNVTSVNEVSFITAGTLGVPTNFRAYPSQTSVSLAWVKGENCTQTQVVYSAAAFPTSNTTGTIYTGTLNTYTHQGLTAGHTYFYSAWGESSGNWSATYATVAATTSAFTVSAGENLETPTAWAEWFQAPDYTNLSNLEPIYSAINELADSFGTPRNTAWQGLILVIIAITSIGLMTTRGGFMAGSVVGLMMTLGGVAIHILSGWLVFIMLVFIIAGWALNQRGVGTE